MKSVIILLCSCCLASLTLVAVTEQWRYDTGEEVLQVVADGKGGCAVFYGGTNSTYSCVWLDRKGRILYQASGPGSGPFGIGITACSPKQLLYADFSTFPQLVQVRKQRAPVPVAALGGFVIGTPFAPVPIPVPSSQVGDRKGFFVVNTNTNAEEDTVIRYSYK